MQPSVPPTFEQMTPAERILYLQDLWDRIAERPEDVPVTDAQRAELNRRLAAYEANPGESIEWEVAREQIRQRK